jgi:histidinol-phosphatase (PHP family)
MKFAKAYYEALSTAADYGKFDIIGHFDLVTKNNELQHFIDTDTARYRSFVADAVSALRGKIPFFELNTGAIARGYRKTPYPDPFLLREMREMGLSVTLGSDCHDNRFLACAFQEALDLLREVGFRSVLSLTENGWREDGI